MSAQKCKSRIAVENALRRATEPVCADELALRTGLHADTVRSHLNNMRNLGLARNTRPGEKTACYEWNHYYVAPPPDQPVAQPISEPPRSCMTFDVYTGEKVTAPPRDGAMHAFTISSLGDTERRRPFIMASSAESLPKST